MSDAQDNLESLGGLPAAEALPVLVDRYGGRIYGLGVRFCGNEADAEDLVQEVFLQAFRKWDQFEGRSAPSTWLYTIAARVCQRRKRKRSGEPEHEVSLEELAPFGESTMAQLPANVQLSMLDEQVQHEAIALVESAIAGLPGHYRLPLVLKDVFEMTVSEVAAVLDLPEGTVKTRVHRARMALRGEIGGALPQTDAAEPKYERQVCLDLLKAKMEAQDRGAAWPLRDEVVCERCQSVFRTLDVAKDACALIALGELPKNLREAIVAGFDEKN